VQDYHFASERIRTWPELLAAVSTLRPMLGVSPSAWNEAKLALGDAGAAIALAAILQRSEHSSEARRHPVGEGGSAILVNGSPAIRSAGGYLRVLSQKAAGGGFTLGPLLMAIMGQRMKAKRDMAG